MSYLKQSAAWWCFASKMEPEQFVRKSVEIGLTALELAEEEYWPLIRESGLSISSWRGHQSLTEGLNKKENHPGIRTEILESLKLAEKWNIPNLIVFSGSRYGLDDARGAEITAEGLAPVVKAAQDAGVNIVLELLNSKIDHPGYQGDRTDWGIKVCRMIGSPGVKLLYDIYHMQVMEGDIIRTINDYHQYFGHYHTAGNPGRNELDASQELNYPAIFRAIAATGYDGYVCHEFVPKGDPAAALQSAYNQCHVEITHDNSKT
jgi:hydroxypyruvate isomerase